MSRDKLYSEVLTEIQAGNPMAAYSAFEKLPLPDQLGLYSVPGVGDVIASVEAGVFGGRAVDKFKQGNVLGGIGDLGITALAGASMLPVIGKFAEGVRGLGRGVQSMRQGDLFGGGGGGGIDQTFKLKLKEKENIENMSVDELNEFIRKNDDRLNDFADEIARGNKLDPSSEALRKTLENRNKIALNAKATKLYDPDFNPSGFDPDFPADRQGIAKQGVTDLAEQARGSYLSSRKSPTLVPKIEPDTRTLDQVGDAVDEAIKRGDYVKTADGVRITKGADEGLNVVLTPAEKQVLRNKELISNREQMLFRLKRELELEGGLVTPRTRKRMMQQITSLTKEIKDLRSKLTD